MSVKLTSDTLAVSLRGAANLMALGAAGAAGKGSEVDNFAALCNLERGKIMPFLVQEFEKSDDGERTVREANPASQGGIATGRWRCEGIPSHRHAQTTL